ncbi:MAG TPA: hypothetical protein EYM67_00350, partial [Candidatus Poseidoniales archaeon]|nr:hypothetical protein [Candidatus Poseidoniales archaeon]
MGRGAACQSRTVRAPKRGRSRSAARMRRGHRSARAGCAAQGRPTTVSRKSGIQAWRAADPAAGLMASPKRYYSRDTPLPMTDARDPVIVSFARTPQGKFGGALAEVSAPDLGGTAIRAAVARAGIAPEAVGEVVMGIVLPAGLGQHPARQAAVAGGIPDAVPAYNINKMCGSGMKALMNAANAIRAGEHDVVVAGGMESMSRTPFLIGRRKWKPDPDSEPVDHLFHDGLCDPYHDIAMGCT